MAKIVGCKQATELALCKQGMNPHAHALMRKAVPTAPVSTPPENVDMADQAEITKAAAALAATMVTKSLAMNDVTKAHYLGLDAAGQEAFMAKSSEEQQTEAAAAKAVKDEAAAVEEARAKGVTATELATQKALADTQAELTALRAERATEKAETEIAKRARTADFAGFPGGEEALVPLLKSAAKLPEDERTAYENVLKAQAAMAKRAGSQLGLRTEEDVMKSAPNLFEVKKAAQDRAKTNGTTEAVELSKMADEPAWSDKVAAATSEEMAA